MVTVTPSKSSSTAAERTDRKRRKALARGLCRCCCKGEVSENRRTCEACNNAAKIRVTRRRERQREQKRVASIARRYEAAGDIAMERFAYIEASVQFERALAEAGNNPETEVRLYEKMGNRCFTELVLILRRCGTSGRSRRASNTKNWRTRVPDLLQRLPRQCWLESRTSEAIGYAREAYELATSDDVRLAAGGLMVNYFVLLGHYEEALTQFNLTYPNPTSIPRFSSAGSVSYS